jgi:hypothetical protein
MSFLIIRNIIRFLFYFKQKHFLSTEKNIHILVIKIFSHILHAAIFYFDFKEDREAVHNILIEFD